MSDEHDPPFELPGPVHPSVRLKAIDAHARRRFGQNFLASEGVIAGIVRAAGLRPGQRVLEIGPGLGAMTRALLAAEVDLTVVELDRDLAGHLRDWLGGSPRLRIVEGDAARQDWSTLLGGGRTVLPDDEKIAVVANLPYNVGTTILTGLLALPGLFSHLVLMLQKEVAERVVAPPGDRARGSLSAYCEARAARRVALKVPPGAFVPAPKVHSAVLRLDLYPAPLTEGLSPALVERVTRVAFAQPRKTVRRCLADALDPALADAALAAAFVPSSARPADLDLRQINALSRALEALGAAEALGLVLAADGPAEG